MDSWEWCCKHEGCEAVGGTGTFDECNAVAGEHVIEANHAITYIVLTTHEPTLDERASQALADALRVVIPALAPLIAQPDIDALVAQATTTAQTDLLLQEA